MARHSVAVSSPTGAEGTGTNSEGYVGQAMVNADIFIMALRHRKPRNEHCFSSYHNRFCGRKGAHIFTYIIDIIVKYNLI